MLPLLLLLLILLPGGVAAQRAQGGDDTDDDRALAYTLRPVPRGAGLVLQVELEFTGDADGESTLTLPSTWGGRERLYEGIRELRALSPRTTLRDGGRPWVKRVTHAPGAAVRVAYEVVQTWRGTEQEGGDRERLYRPMLARDYVHFFGSGVFVRASEESGRPVPVTLRWRDVPDDWTLADSWAARDRGARRRSRDEWVQRFTASPSELDYSVFVGGDFRLHQVRTAGGPITVAVRGRWTFDDDEFLDVVERVVRAEREFWEERDTPYYLVTLIPTGERGGGNLGGTGLTNSVALYAYDDVRLGIEMKRTIAHELFHAWNPARITARSDGYERHRWFGEGVTEYYARAVLLRAGLITPAEYVADVNQRLHGYYTSPVRTASDREAARGFFSDSRLSELPYQRGDLLALRWSARIREASRGQASLDDVMRALLRRAERFEHDPDSVFTADALAAAVRRYTGRLGHDPREDIRRYVERGELLPADSAALGPCVELLDASFGPFDLGFDAAALGRAGGEVRGVDPDGNAYRAGLREGQRLRAISYAEGVATRPVRVTVFADSAGPERTIEYLPQGRPRTVIPQYEVRAACSAAEVRKGLL